MLQRIVNKIKNNPEGILWAIATVASTIGYGLGKLPISLFFYSGASYGLSQVPHEYDQERYCISTMTDVVLFLYSRDQSLTFLSGWKFGYDIVRWAMAEHNNKIKDDIKVQDAIQLIVDKKHQVVQPSAEFSSVKSLNWVLTSNPLELKKEVFNNMIENLTFEELIQWLIFIKKEERAKTYLNLANQNNYICPLSKKLMITPILLKVGRFANAETRYELSDLYHQTNKKLRSMDYEIDVKLRKQCQKFVDEIRDAVKALMKNYLDEQELSSKLQQEGPYKKLWKSPTLGTTPSVTESSTLIQRSKN